MGEFAVFLDNPKFRPNVGGVLRAVHCYGGSELAWSGTRVLDADAVKEKMERDSLIPDEFQSKKGKFRLPREERLRVYQNIPFGIDNGMVDRYIADGFTPVCVELTDNAELLPLFEHPERALYIFGPEDGSVNKGIRHVCHRFVKIPTATCMNLSAAANVVLYDRMAKEFT